MYLLYSSDYSVAVARLSSFSFKSLSFIKFVIYLVNSTVLICRVPLSEKNESLIRCMCSFCKVFTVRRKGREGQNNDEGEKSQKSTTYYAYWFRRGCSRSLLEYPRKLVAGAEHSFKYSRRLGYRPRCYSLLHLMPSLMWAGERPGHWHTIPRAT